jgi:hypothetical protein
MKKFLFRLLLFTAPILVLSYAADAFLSRNLKKLNSGESPVWRDIFEGKINSDIVIYGSSRAWQHIDPQALTDSLHYRAYNIGMQAYPFEMQYLRHQLLLKYNKKPKLIIHSLDFLTFQKRADLYDPAQFLPYMLWDTLVKKHTINYLGYTAFDYTLPLARYYGKTAPIHQAISLSSALAPNPPDRVRGYKGTGLEFTDAFAEGKAGMKTYTIKFDSATIRMFDDYLASCRRNNISVLFVYTPEYITGQRYVSNRAKLFALINKFSVKYHIPLYNYSKDTMCYQQKYFYNAEHLNAPGSDMFSKKFAAELKNSKWFKALNLGR